VIEPVQLRVLLVDDEASYVKVVALGLREEYGMDVLVASSGQEAIDLLQSEKDGFDVVVLDYLMPELTGLDVLRWMNRFGVETPALMLTAAGSESTAVESMKLGAYDYCRKEDTDIQHLANLIRASHERHLFRVTSVLEEERSREITLNKEATDKVNDVINAMTPALNSAFANIAVDLEMNQEQLFAGLPASEQSRLKQLFLNVQKEVLRIEAGVRGLLALYKLLYARYPESKEIERIRTEFEERANSET
jgi:DNA-binding response OmpR family regulator